MWSQLRLFIMKARAKGEGRRTSSVLLDTFRELDKPFIQVHQEEFRAVLGLRGEIRTAIWLESPNRK
jgi:hypothetical protein